MNVIDKLNQRFKDRFRSFYRKVLLLDKLTEILMPADADEVSNPSHLARNSILFGVWLTFLVFGVFGAWSALAPLNSSAIATGKVVVDSNRKVIDHLEGGIVEEIMVQDGQLVKKDQPLVRLRAISAKARVQLLKDKYITNLASEARLLAERDGLEEIKFPDELLKQKDDPQVADIIDNQRRIFKTRTQNVQGQLDILGTRIAKHEQEIKGLEMQATSMISQIALLNEEIDVVEDLVKKGNATRPRLLSLKRQAAELQGRKGEYMALKAKAKESIDETQLAMLNTESEYLNSVVEELKETQSQLADLRERMTASSDILERIIIRAPEGGIVNDLSVHTVGGTIKPGEKLMDIIPSDKLIIEARIALQDIDVVRPGLDARVRLTAYKARTVPMVEGKVVFVSADQLVEERTGEAYFLARVEIEPQELADLGEGIELYPGMPAEVFIITGSRTFLAYMMDPITESFRHSFRQQ